MFVIDVLRYDIENVASILRLLNNRGSIGWRKFRDQDFTTGEVISALNELVRMRMVLVLSEDRRTGTLTDDQDPKRLENRIDSLWFKLTKEGMEAWEKWTPPSEPQHSLP